MLKLCLGIEKLMTRSSSCLARSKKCPRLEVARNDLDDSSRKAEVNVSLAERHCVGSYIII